MVEFLHAFREASEFEGDFEEWVDTVEDEGFDPDESIEDFVYLYDPQNPPDESLLEKPCFRVNVREEEIKVRSWWTSDGNGGVRDYSEWDPENEIGTEFLYEETVSPEQLSGPYKSGYDAVY